MSRESSGTYSALFNRHQGHETGKDRISGSGLWGRDDDQDPISVKSRDLYLLWDRLQSCGFQRCKER
eukprot:15366495-Ditylum_brightwellii.AAC.2